VVHGRGLLLRNSSTSAATVATNSTAITTLSIASDYAQLSVPHPA
jgi:hypothetical protein